VRSSTLIPESAGIMFAKILTDVTLYRISILRVTPTGNQPGRGSGTDYSLVMFKPAFYGASGSVCDNGLSRSANRVPLGCHITKTQGCISCFLTGADSGDVTRSARGGDNQQQRIPV
jgi:hypothetical protein